ncbi:hypothetical protein ACS0TY_035786 [Phlomoides rotata]
MISASQTPKIGLLGGYALPRTLYPEQITSVRVLQLSGNVAVYPYEMFVTYLLAVCDNAVEGKKLQNAAINALFSMPVSGESNDGTYVLHEHTFLRISKDFSLF